MNQPNILFILTDQHNASISGFEGNRIIDTPSLDGLASQGMQFGKAYCQSPLCVPSRSSLLTGRYCRNINVYDNQDILDTAYDTIPGTFAAAGYSTALVGKAHFNGEQYHGYQYRPYGDIFGQGHQPDPRRVPEKGDAGLGDILYQAGPSQIPLPLTQTEICTHESVKWLQSHVSLHPDQPFFLSVHYDKPHFPINPPPSLYEKYRDLVQLPPHWRHGLHGDSHLKKLSPFVRENFICEGSYQVPEETHLNCLAAYYGCIEWVDTNIGRLLESLDYLGLSDNTIVVYSSDHGDMASYHGSWQKMVFYDHSSRVPLIMKYPGIIPEAEVCLDPVGLIDLFPTFCGMANLTIPEGLDGINLAPHFSGELIGRDRIYGESVLIHKPQFAGAMVRTNDWKCCYYLDGSVELYDMENDPEEENNLAIEESSTAEELVEDIKQFWNPEEQIFRYNKNPKSPREKHFYPYSNQYFANGGWFDARP
ncbi:hypothetical protein EXM22_01520 [Oceanispirochaeta crateris]|uniref:Sulfatase N-terminal domain-containing protein n=1 Tax=Oceanispirochaeta crateris TaxID=2518645 RepID=A0A5C1QF51_9SPIO|nr:sulfatase-like hydrolase/transferase [Oceanispirochaeta crateris]QEN06733.1 hypothetical protein EXM22_01520 [Oceanispirochaeta crateris]